MKTKRIAVDAMLIAMYFVLGNYLALNLGGIRITLDVVPVIVGAALFGPADGLIIGLMGNFLFQLAGPYGISATTILWVLPDALRGLLAGILLRGWRRTTGPRMGAALIMVSLAATTLTTGVMYADCLIYQYSFEIYAPLILWRYIIGVVVAVLTTLALPPLLKALDKAIGRPNGGLNANNGN